MKNLKFPLKPGKCEKVPIKDLFRKGECFGFIYLLDIIAFIYSLDIILNKITSDNSIKS